MCDRKHSHRGSEQNESKQEGELAGGRDVDEVPENGAADERDGCLTHQEYTDPVFAWTWDMLAASFEAAALRDIRSSYGTPALSTSAVGITGTIYVSDISNCEDSMLHNCSPLHIRNNPEEIVNHRTSNKASLAVHSL
jgi:hypothetical protein